MGKSKRLCPAIIAIRNITQCVWDYCDYDYGFIAECDLDDMLEDIREKFVKAFDEYEKYQKEGQ